MGIVDDMRNELERNAQSSTPRDTAHDAPPAPQTDAPSTPPAGADTQAAKVAATRPTHPPVEATRRERVTRWLGSYLSALLFWRQKKGGVRMRINLLEPRVRVEQEELAHAPASSYTTLGSITPTDSARTPIASGRPAQSSSALTPVVAASNASADQNDNTPPENSASPAEKKEVAKKSGWAAVVAVSIIVIAVIAALVATGLTTGNPLWVLAVGLVITLILVLVVFASKLSDARTKPGPATPPPDTPSQPGREARREKAKPPVRWADWMWRAVVAVAVVIIAVSGWRWYTNQPAKTASAAAPAAPALRPVMAPQACPSSITITKEWSAPVEVPLGYRLVFDRQALVGFEVLPSSTNTAVAYPRDIKGRVSTPYAQSDRFRVMQDDPENSVVIKLNCVPLPPTPEEKHEDKPSAITPDAPETPDAAPAPEPEAPQPQAPKRDLHILPPGSTTAV